MASNKKVISEKKVKKNKLYKTEEEMEDDTSEMLISEKKVKKNKSSKAEEEMKKVKKNKSSETEEEMEDDTTEMFISEKKVKKKKKKNKSSKTEEEMEDDTTETKSSWGNMKEHKEQLERLQKKDPEFYEFLEKHDKELLEVDDEEDGLDDEDMDDEDGADDEDMDDEDGLDDEDMDVHHVGSIGEKQDEASKKVITSAMVDSWCSAILEDARVGAVRSIMRAFRTACHYGDDGGADPSAKLSIMSSSVFNKIMLFVLTEMDGILRTLLKLPASGGKKESILELVHTRAWKNYNHLVKSYLGNALHVLTQMTDTEMISFTIRRLKYSSLFLAAFPSLLRKYIKAVLHFWGTGGGALPVVSFLFLRDLCVRLGSDCVDECFKGIYKTFILSSQFVNATKLQHVQFLANCVNELLGVDLPAAYQHAFVFIRQLAMILREALDTRKKNSYAKVYEWKYINCLELWTGAVCAYGAESDLKPLAYPLTQIISGVARLVPTARYLPLRLRCVKMLNRIAASTNTFIPVAVILLDMLDMKELNRPPTGGVGKAVDLRATLRVSKATLKTRLFQEACVFSVIEELAEHLAQWSYSVAFTELSFIPSVRLRNFCKSTKVDRFRRETREFIRQIESNSDFTNKKRMSIKYLPNDPAAESFLEDEKKSGVSPLSQYASMLRQRAQERSDSLKESSVLVGENSSIFGRKRAGIDDDDDDDSGNEVGAAVFNSSWLPKGNPKTKPSEEEKKGKKKKRKKTQEEDVAGDEDIVQDLVLSSEEDEDDDPFDTEQKGIKPVTRKQQTQSQRKKPSGKFAKKENFQAKKSNKRKRANK